MANMFSGKTNQQIPTNLNECTQEDPTVSNLHLWAERLENWGRILFWALIIIGIIVTLVTTIETYELLEDLGISVDLDELALAGIEIPSVPEVLLSNILKWSLYAFLEYCAYHALALLISALASITQNTIITAKVALYTAAKNTNVNTTVFSNETTGGCGQTMSQTSAPNGMWACHNCGTHNKNEYGQCKKCGQHRAR